MRSAGILGVLLLAAACHEGSGSDIGPKLAKGPSYDYRVLVRDDASRPVVSARVSISGGGPGALTAHTGRAFLHEFYRGSRLVTVDGTYTAAADSSRLVSLTVAAAFPDGDELPYVFYLPDHGASAGLSLTTGTQSTTGTLDDSGSSGATLTVNTGEVVGFGGAASVDVRTAKLSVGHLPATLNNGGAPLLSSRAIYIYPEGVAFQNGAGLSIPDDMGLSAAQVVSVFRLDRMTGLWTSVGTAVESGGNIVATAPTASIQQGGLYTFGVSVATTTIVTGRVLDDDQRAVSGVLVRGPQASTRTGSDGRFTLPAMARTTGAGADRSVTIEFHGGRDFLPTRTAVTTTLNAASVTLADVTLSTRLATNLRVLLINRGETVPNRRFRVSGREHLSDSETVIGGDGIGILEEVSADVQGYLTSVPRNINSIYRTRSLLFLRAELDNATSIFSDDYGWRQALAGGTLIESVDRFGTGAIYDTHVIAGDVPGVGHDGQTDFNGMRGIGVPGGSLVTTALKTELGGDVVYSAFGMLGAQDGRFEMPSERVRRRFGAFRRFGMVRGDLTNLAGSNTRRARASGAMTKQCFLDETIFGRFEARRVPVHTLPSATSVGFQLGVPAGAGQVAGAEGTTTGAYFTLDRLGFAEVTAVEGALVDQDVPLVAATSSFPIRNALLDRDANIPAADFGFDLAGDRGDRFVVDLVRGVGGATSVVVAGNDATLRLPPLPAGITSYYTVFGGTNVASGVTRRQQTVVELDGVNTPDVPLLPLPVVTSPAPAATVAAGGFSVRFTLPQAAHYGVVQLRWSGTVSGKNETRDWTVVVPRWGTEVKFFDLPPQAPDVLAARSNWTLTVRAARVGSGLLIDPRNSYDETHLRILSNWIGMPEADRLENGFSSISFQITTN